MDSELLKPCPFCGGNNVEVCLEYFTWHPKNERKGCFVVCHDCQAAGPVIIGNDYDKSAAAEAWNRQTVKVPTCAAPWDPDRNRYCCQICGHYVGKYDAFCGGCGAKLTDYTPEGRGKKNDRSAESVQDRKG